MSTDVEYRFDPRDEYREVLRKRRFRRKLWRTGLRWVGFTSAILLTVFVFLEAVYIVGGEISKVSTP